MENEKTNGLISYRGLPEEAKSLSDQNHKNNDLFDVVSFVGKVYEVGRPRDNSLENEIWIGMTVKVYTAIRNYKDYIENTDKFSRDQDSRNQITHVVAIVPVHGAQYRISTYRLWNFKFTDEDTIYTVKDGVLTFREIIKRPEGTNCTEDNFEDIDGSTLTYTELCDAINVISEK